MGDDTAEGHYGAKCVKHYEGVGSLQLMAGEKSGAEEKGRVQEAEKENSETVQVEAVNADDEESDDGHVDHASRCDGDGDDEMAKGEMSGEAVRRLD